VHLPEYVKTVIDMLINAGFEAFAVGGCVRDSIMGKNPNDYDITTSALPEEIKSVFSDFRTIDTGIKHGTVTVLVQNEPIEVTTYRIDGSYSDSRHPDKVEFADNISADLSRRDFTINAIAYNEKQGIVDRFGGVADIENGIIRCVGDPEKRFSEDALRIFRALRFSSVLDFDIDEETKQAAFSKKELLLNVSVERLAVEFTKMLCGKGVRRVLTDYIDIIGVIIPEISGCKNFWQNNPYHIYDVLLHTAVAVESIPAVLHLRLAAFFHDIAKPICYSVDENGVGHFYGHNSLGSEITEKVLTRLKFDNNTKQKVVTLVKYHDLQINLSEKSILKLLNKLGTEAFFDLIKVFRADNAAQNPEYNSRLKKYDELEYMANEIIKKQQCFSLKHLAVNGKDLIELGFSEGKLIGETLNIVLEAVIDGVVKNEKENLIAFIKSLNKKA